MLLFYKELGNQYTLGKILFIKILSKFFMHLFLSSYNISHIKIFDQQMQYVYYRFCIDFL